MTDAPAQTPRRTAYVVTGAISSTVGAGVAPVTMPRLPWEPDPTMPDDRRETMPRGPAIRNPDLDETRGWMAPAKSLRLARHFETATSRVIEREVR